MKTADSRLELVVLAVLDAGPLHGYGLKAEIARRTDGAIDPAAGTLYPLLNRLEARGLLAAGPRRDRRRRAYELTAAGRAALGRRLADWVRLVAAVTRAIGAG